MQISKIASNKEVKVAAKTNVAIILKLYSSATISVVAKDQINMKRRSL